LAVLALGFILLYFVLFGIPLVSWGFQASNAILTPEEKSNRKVAHEFVPHDYEHQLYMEKLKKRRLRRQRFKQLTGL